MSRRRARTGPRSRTEAYMEISKTRIVSLVLVTAAIGYLLGGQGIASWWVFAALMVGTAMTAAGSGALNSFLEREADSRMDRTRNRPLPLGEISPANAMAYGVILVLGGTALLWTTVNLLTAFLALLTAFLYVIVYTPMKRLTWLNTLVGAIPGALPPMGGWAAATGRLDAGAWALFAILFIWQMPHFYAIAWMFKDDYRKGGFKMLPVVQPDGRSTFAQMGIFAALLVPASVVPVWLGTCGWVYGAGALVLGVLFFLASLRLAGGHEHAFADARRVLRASIVYLPALLLLIVVDFSM